MGSNIPHKQLKSIFQLTSTNEPWLGIVRSFKIALTFFRSQLFLNKTKQNKCVKKVTSFHSLPISSRIMFLCLNSYLIKSADSERHSFFIRNLLKIAKNHIETFVYLALAF